MIQQVEESKGDETTGRNGFAADQAGESGRSLEGAMPAQYLAQPEIHPDLAEALAIINSMAASQAKINQARDVVNLEEPEETPAPPEKPEPEPAKEPEARLPVVQDILRSCPNHIARSSLFAPLARGPRKAHRGTVMVSRSDAVIRYWGDQLTEDQADVWMHALHLASKYPLGEPVPINRAQFLRDIGRGTAAKDYDWLHKAMHDLSFGMIVIDIKTTGRTVGEAPPPRPRRNSRTLHMVSGFDLDHDSGEYRLFIDPRWQEIYGRREYGLIDWEARLQFGFRQDLAKSMQRLIAATNATEQRYDLDWLKGRMEHTSPLWKFKPAILKACAELARLEIIHSAAIEKSRKGPAVLVIHMIDPTPAENKKQLQHLTKGLGGNIRRTGPPRKKK